MVYCPCRRARLVANHWWGKDMRAVSFISRLGLSVGLVLGIGSVAMAASSSNFAKYPGTTFAYSIAPGDMSPGAYTIQYYVDSSVYIEGETTDYGCFNDGVHLPPGAIMKQLVVSY